MDWVGDYTEGLLLAGMFIGAVLLVWNITLTLKVSNVKKSLKRWTGDTSLQAFDEVMSKIQERQGLLMERQDQLRSTVGEMQQKLQKVKGNVGVNRYNAFAETGSDLSFSVAIVDEGLNGVVLSGIRNREDSHIYAKPLAEGKSTYTLTPEERDAINRASQR